MATIQELLIGKYRQGLAYAIPSVRTLDVACDKRTELEHHLIDFFESEASETEVGGNIGSNTVASTKVPVASMLAAEAPSRMMREVAVVNGELQPLRRKAAMFRVNGVFEVTVDLASNCTMDLRVGPTSGGQSAMQWVIPTGRLAGRQVHVQGTVFFRPDANAANGYRPSFTGMIIDGGVVATGETGPSNLIHNQAWSSTGNLFIACTLQFAAADASRIKVRQWAVERVF